MSAGGKRRSVPLHPKLDLSANKLRGRFEIGCSGAQVIVFGERYSMITF